MAEELVARAREQGVSLTGPDGLLKQRGGRSTVYMTGIGAMLWSLACAGRLGRFSPSFPSADDWREPVLIM